MKGRYAFDVDGNTRVALGWDAGHAAEVEYGGYH
jgi:hypothetical protein